MSVSWVTGSAKTQHNRTSLNFQYKALNVMGEILAYFKKYYGIILNTWFIEKETSSNKHLDIIWFAYSRGVQKSLFCCSRPKDTPVMGVCLRHVEIILRDWFFPIDFALVCSEEKWYTEKTCPVFDSPIHSKHDGANCNSVYPFVHKVPWF